MDIRVAVDRDSGVYETFRRWLVVPDEAGLQNAEGEELLTDAREELADIEEGDYIAFVFFDQDDNGFYDDGELAAIYKEDGLPRKIAIRKDRTETLALPLTQTPELPH